MEISIDEEAKELLFSDKVIIEKLCEVVSCLGRKLINIQINIGRDTSFENGAYCNEDCEIMLEFDNGKEWRIFINEDGKLQIYSD